MDNRWKTKDADPIKRSPGSAKLPSIVDIITALPASGAFSPLDHQLQLEDPHLSERVSQLAVWLSGQVPFGKAEAILEKVGQIHLPATTIWRQSQVRGQAFQQVEEATQSQAEQVETRAGVVPGEVRVRQRLGVSMDGVMVHIRTEGWKELKLGCLFEIVPRERKDDQIQELVEVGQAQELSYTAYLGGPEVFGQRLWAEAKRRHWTQAMDTEVLGDGAVWIWNLAEQHFYDSVPVVDWYHAKSHLVNAAQALLGEGTSSMCHWLKEQETVLFEGQAEAIVDRLRHPSKPPADPAGVQTEAGYFETNKRRMEYLDRRMEGWLIGSGMVESGAKQYQARMTGPGMQWSREGAERMIPIRSAILSNRFDEVWNQAKKLTTKLKCTPFIMYHGCISGTVSTFVPPQLDKKGTSVQSRDLRLDSPSNGGSDGILPYKFVFAKRCTGETGTICPGLAHAMGTRNTGLGTL